MKHTLILVFLLASIGLCAQNDSTKLDRDFPFRNGIYTSVIEILHNSPKYPDVILVNDGSKLPVKADSIVAFVKNGKMTLRYNNQFQKLILVGSLSTFLISSQGVDLESALTAGASAQGVGARRQTQETVYCLDFKTGRMNRLTSEFMDEILKRDTSLQLDFSLLSKKEKKQTLYSYVLKYNARHPTYIKNN